MGLPSLPIELAISGSLAGAIFAAQVAQLGFEATLLRKTTRLETRMDYEIEREDDRER